jgi:hypothetical protein
LYCLQIVKLLVDAGANLEATIAAHSSGWPASNATPLVGAAAAGKLEIMQILLGE